MKLFPVFLFQLLTWFSVQEMRIAELSASEALKQRGTRAARVVLNPQPRWWVAAPLHHVGWVAA